MVITCSHDASHFLIMPRYDALRQMVGEDVQIRVVIYHHSVQSLPSDPSADIVLTAEPDMCQRQEWQIVQSQLNLDGSCRESHHPYGASGTHGIPVRRVAQTSPCANMLPGLSWSSGARRPVIPIARATSPYRGTETAAPSGDGPGVRPPGRTSPPAVHRFTPC